MALLMQPPPTARVELGSNGSPVAALMCSAIRAVVFPAMFPVVLTVR
jgi:hypothetical protein